MPLLEKPDELTGQMLTVSGGGPCAGGERVERFAGGLCFIAVSPATRALRQRTEVLAKADVPVLISGETGSGKETVARLMHALSPRSAAGFLSVTCAGLPGFALEWKLFGAVAEESEPQRSNPGQFENCQHGTLFLNDIVDMSPASQAQLLRILKKHPPFRSSSSVVDADVRILAATSFPLDHTLLKHGLRKDLYYSLSAFELHVPPLRERREDIPYLIEHFLAEQAKTYNLPVRPMSPATVAACEAHPWPGNLRQLQNVIRQYVVVGDQDSLLTDLERTSRGDHSASGEVARNSRDERAGLKSFVRVVRDKTEKDLIVSALCQTGWNRKVAAHLLNISYRSLLYKIEEHQLSPPKKHA